MDASFKVSQTNYSIPNGTYLIKTDVVFGRLSGPYKVSSNMSNIINLSNICVIRLLANKSLGYDSKQAVSNDTNYNIIADNGRQEKRFQKLRRGRWPDSIQMMNEYCLINGNIRNQCFKQIHLNHDTGYSVWQLVEKNVILFDYVMLSSMRDKNFKCTSVYTIHKANRFCRLKMNINSSIYVDIVYNIGTLVSLIGKVNLEQASIESSLCKWSISVSNQRKLYESRKGNCCNDFYHNAFERFLIVICNT